MTLEDGELVKLAFTVGTITYSVVFGIVAKKVWDVPKNVESRLDRFEERLVQRISTIEDHQGQVDQRISVHDRISSKIIGKDFDSSSIVKSGSYPEIKTNHAI